MEYPTDYEFAHRCFPCQRHFWWLPWSHRQWLLQQSNCQLPAFFHLFFRPYPGPPPKFGQFRWKPVLFGYQIFGTGRSMATKCPPSCFTSQLPVSDTCRGSPIDSFMQRAQSANAFSPQDPRWEPSIKRSFEDYLKWELLPIHKWVVLLIDFIKDWDMLVMKSEKGTNPRQTTNYH